MRKYGKKKDAEDFDRFYTLDCETDPFLFGREPRPFAWGLYCNLSGQYWHTWGKKCTAEIVAILKGLPPGIIYAHNGGKFDYHFLFDFIAKGEEVMIISGRVARAKLFRHEIRDSINILPVSLAKMHKTKIDYGLMEAKVREKHREEIQSYLKDDCTNLAHIRPFTEI